MQEDETRATAEISYELPPINRSNLYLYTWVGILQFYRNACVTISNIIHKQKYTRVDGLGITIIAVLYVLTGPWIITLAIYRRI